MIIFYRSFTMGNFEKIAKHISKKEGVSMESARKILAAGARHASPAAKSKNPNLAKVKGA